MEAPEGRTILLPNAFALTLIALRGTDATAVLNPTPMRNKERSTFRVKKLVC
ncbi:hypothetical protein GGQ07_003247 [Salinibacter ruber]|nr:hypothetical protein [Salinibacter ruber]